MLERGSDRTAPGEFTPPGMRNSSERMRATTKWREVLPVAVCIVLGLAMALLPSIVQRIQTGLPVWIANGDEVYYIAVGSQSYCNHPSYLSDPVLRSGGTSLFRQLPLLPGVWLARAFNLGPLGINICWRVLGGLSLGAAWYVLVRQFVRDRWLAAALTAILLADRGLLGAGLVFRQVQGFARLLSGNPWIVQAAYLHPAWRLASPALTMAFLLLHIWLVTRARLSPTRLWLILSGISFGLLFHVYPYYWMTAALALGLAFLIDRDGRLVYLYTSAVALPIGGLRLYWDWTLTRSRGIDWLIRTGKFIEVSRFADLKPPILAGLILIAGLVWIWKRQRQAIYLWTMALAGYVLFKNHILTGRNLENYHWYYVWGPCCSLLLLLMIADLLARDEGMARVQSPIDPGDHDGGNYDDAALPPRRVGKGRIAFLALMAVAAADVAMGLSLRSAETFLAESTLLVENCTDYRAQRIDTASFRLVAGSTVAGADYFASFASILENQRPLYNYWVYLSPYINDAEWYDRIALNQYLLGQDGASFAVWASKMFLNGGQMGWGPWRRDPLDGERRYRSLLSAYDAMAQAPNAALDRFGVRYVGLPAGQDPPGYLIKESWTRLQEGPFWQVWERFAATPR